MDKGVGVVLLVLLALIHLSNCQQAYNYTGNCIKITLRITANIRYPQESGKYGSVVIKGSDYSTEDPLVYCEDEIAQLNIYWMDLYSLTLDFKENKATTWDVSNIQFEYDASELVHPTIDGDTMENKDTGITNVNLGYSYRCKNGTTYNLTGHNSTVQLTLSDLQLQAFKFNEAHEFGKAKDCHVIPPNPPNNNSTIINVYNKKCSIHVNMEVRSISIDYKNSTGGKIKVNAMVKKKNYTVTSTCHLKGKTRSSQITISWPLKAKHYNLSIMFSADYNKGKQGWKIDGMNFGYVLQEDSTILQYNKDFTDDKISLTRSFRCDGATYNFASKSSNGTATLAVTHLQLQAFKFSDPKNGTFGGPALKCNQGVTSAIVPIVVGSLLGLFVIILLLAYALGRVRQWRISKRGYHRL